MKPWIIVSLIRDINLPWLENSWSPLIVAFLTISKFNKTVLHISSNHFSLLHVHSVHSHPIQTTKVSILFLFYSLNAKVICWRQGKREAQRLADKILMFLSSSHAYKRRKQEIDREKQIFLLSNSICWVLKIKIGEHCAFYKHSINTRNNNKRHDIFFFFLCFA